MKNSPLERKRIFLIFWSFPDVENSSNSTLGEPFIFSFHLFENESRPLPLCKRIAIFTDIWMVRASSEYLVQERQILLEKCKTFLDVGNLYLTPSSKWMFCGFLCAVKPCAKCAEHTQVGIVDRGTRVLLSRSSRSHLRSRQGITASVCVRVRVCMHVCVCVQVYALRENVNVVMKPERTLVIGAIDRNHLM